MRTNAEPADRATIGEAVVALVRIATFYTFSAIYIPIVILVALVKPGSTYYPLAQFWVWLGLKIFAISTTVEGLEKLASDRDYVVLANHRSHFDVLAIVDALHERETRWVAKSELRKVPIFGTGLRVTGQIIVDRGDHEQAIRTLRENVGSRGVSVVFFPEGHRAPTTKLLPFKKGAAAFAIDAGLPIVPVAVSGSERVLRTQSWMVHPGRIRVIVGDPIDVRSMTSADRERLTSAARRAIGALLERVEGESPLEDETEANNV